MKLRIKDLLLVVCLMVTGFSIVSFQKEMMRKQITYQGSEVSSILNNLVAVWADPDDWCYVSDTCTGIEGHATCLDPQGNALPLAGLRLDYDNSAQSGKVRSVVSAASTDRPGRWGTMVGGGRGWTVWPAALINPKYLENGVWKPYSGTLADFKPNKCEPITASGCAIKVSWGSGCVDNIRYYCEVNWRGIAKHIDYQAPSCYTPTATPVPVVPVCVNVKVYKAGAVVTDYSQIVAGDVLQIAVAGANVTQGRISVNGAAPVVTTTRNAAGEYYIDYTVPADGGAISIDSWVSE